MKNRIEMILEVPATQAQAIIAALKKEDASNKRFSSTISMKGGKLSIEVEAEDIVALRSTLNSYLRYLQTIESVENAEL